MGWSYREISFEDLMKLIKSFVDMLLLASGYQSTGRPAHWQPDNIKKALQWALFLENVSKGLTSSDTYKECVQELNTALSELSSNSSFPQGFGPLSCNVLGRARVLLLERLIQTLPLKESHLKAIITAAIEMDFNRLRTIENDYLDLYLEKLMLNALRKPDLSEVPNVSSTVIIPSRKQENEIEGDFSLDVIGELERRQLVSSFLSVAENGLGIMLETTGENMHRKVCETINAERMKNSSSLIAEELPVESIVWNHWRSKSLSYMLDKRTIRMASGASLIFSASKSQWDQMFDRLNLSSESDDNLCEMIELLLLGRVANRWTTVIQRIMSISYEPITISRLYSEVLNLPLGKFRISDKSSMDVKEKSVIDYLEVLLRSHIKQLWKLSPIVAAIAIPSWPQLFRFYLLELEGQIRGHSSAPRCCSCITDEVEHRECEVAERIWCLYIFHVHHAASGTIA